MDEIKLWRIGDGGSLSSLGAMARLENELAFEELLVAHPELLEPELELVGRQLPAAGGWLDLLAVDATGRLVIYELKRGILGRDAVTQLLDYASAMSEMNLDDLATHIASRSGQGGIKQIPDFEEWYCTKFSDPDSLCSLDLFVPTARYHVCPARNSSRVKSIKNSGPFPVTWQTSPSGTNILPEPGNV